MCVGRVCVCVYLCVLWMACANVLIVIAGESLPITLKLRQKFAKNDGVQHKTDEVKLTLINI